MNRVAETDNVNHAPAAGIIAAAGSSKRMGIPKALLPLNGMSMIERLIKSMIEAGADPIIVVTGHAAEQVRRELEGYPIVFVHNEQYDNTQMFHSLLLGAAMLDKETEKVLFCPADSPAASVDTMRKLLLADGDYVSPSFHMKAGHPVILSRRLLRSLQEYTGNGGLRDAALEAGAQRRFLSVDDEGILIHANTPEEYVKMCEWMNTNMRE